MELFEISIPYTPTETVSSNRKNNPLDSAGRTRIWTMYARVFISHMRADRRVLETRCRYSENRSYIDRSRIITMHVVRCVDSPEFRSVTLGCDGRRTMWICEYHRTSKIRDASRIQITMQCIWVWCRMSMGVFLKINQTRKEYLKRHYISVVL